MSIRPELPEVERGIAAAIFGRIAACGRMILGFRNHLGLESHLFNTAQRQRNGDPAPMAACRFSLPD
jgi:hypothetical protein